MAYLDGRSFQIDTRSLSPHAVIVFNGDGTSNIHHIDVDDLQRSSAELNNYLDMVKSPLRANHWVLRAKVDDIAVVYVQTRGQYWKDVTQKHLVGESWVDAWINFQARLTRYDQYVVKEGVNQVEPIRFPKFQEYVRRVFPHDAQIFDQQDPSQLATRRALGNI